MKQDGDNIMGRQMITFHLTDQSYKKKITFAKRQAINALIILNEKTNKNFRLETYNTHAERVKKEKKWVV